MIKIEFYCFFFFCDITKVLMLGTYHAKFQVFMSKGSAINWAAISDFDWPPLQIQIWPGITERTGTWGGVTSSNHDRKKEGGYFSSQIKFKTKIKIKTLFRLIIRRYTSWIHIDSEYFWSSCERGWLDDVTVNSAVVKYSGLQVHERRYCGRVFTIFGGLYQGRKN